ncbi:hypothetical protein HDU97_009037 [Phlyctochytrium planicorne]|nr:hypothetical protein HDU97_009037 [Phlyctochytrium planicorne]
MDVAIAESLNILRYTMIKPLYFLVVLAEIFNMLLFIFADRYRTSYSVQPSIPITNPQTYIRSPDSASTAEFAGKLQICTFVSSMLALVLLILAAQIARYKFIKVLRERLGEGEKKKGQRNVRHDKSTNDQNGSHVMSGSDMESAAASVDIDKILKVKKNKGSNPAKERMIDSMKSAIFVLGVIVWSTVGVVVALLVLTTMTQVFPSPTVLYFVSIYGDSG